MARNTIVYGDGGDYHYGSNFSIKSAQQWIKWGKERDAGRWMYKGYRVSDGIKSQVVVFDNTRWRACEIARRKANGFLGIREYKVGDIKYGRD